MKKSFLSKLLVVLVMLTLILTACTPTVQQPDPTKAPDPTQKAVDPTDAPPDDELEEVELVWHTQVDVVRPDTDMVIEELNKYLKEKINATIGEYHTYIAADYREKLPTLINSQQYMDIVFTGRSYNFVTNAQQNAFYPLEELIAEYMPNTKAIVPEGAWDAATFDGHIYGIVPYKDLAARWSFLYNKTMTDNYGIAVPESGSWSTFGDLVPFIRDAKEKRDANEPDLKDLPIMGIVINVEAWRPYEAIQGLAVANIPGVQAFEGKGNGETVFNIYDTDEYLQICLDIKELVDDGIFPYDGQNFDKDRDLLNAHKLLGSFPQGYIEILGDMYPGRETAHTTSKLVVMSNGYVQAFLQALSVQTKNPERSAMFLELLNTDPVVGNLMRFGIEDQHYEVVSDGRIDITNSPRNGGGKAYAEYGYYFWYGGQFGNILAGHTPTFVSDEFPNKLKELNDNSIQDTNLGFSFDQSPVANEIAACANVIAEYDSNTNLRSGMVEDVEGIWAEFITKLESNGSQKIIDEAQKQLTAWRTSVGKPTN